MGLDVSLLAVPKEAKVILNKAEMKPSSEYNDAIFSLHLAFGNSFTDFGHHDWLELKKDALDVIKYYPESKFQSKYYLDTNRTYEVFDYLLSKREDAELNFKDSAPFFYDGIECVYSKSGQGHTLKYWDLDILNKKRRVIDSIDFEELFELYDFEKMVDEEVYKIKQLNEKTKELKSQFVEIKSFLENAIELNGYVFIFKT